jgi:hypothetical protein
MGHLIHPLPAEDGWSVNKGALEDGQEHANERIKRHAPQQQPNRATQNHRLGALRGLAHGKAKNKNGPFPRNRTLSYLLFMGKNFMGKSVCLHARHVNHRKADVGKSTVTIDAQCMS